MTGVSHSNPWARERSATPATRVVHQHPPAVQAQALACWSKSRDEHTQSGNKALWKKLRVAGVCHTETEQGEALTSANKPEDALRLQHH